MMKLSAVILTKNEEKNIGPCLRSVSWCDEVIVVDDYSQDSTLARCQEVRGLKSLRIFQRRLGGDFAAQRNFGLEKTKGEWVLFVDADERVSAALAAEIKYQISNIEYRIFGFYLKRQDFWGGRQLRHGETSQVKLLRLANRGTGRWKRRVHEVWDVKGKVGELSNPLFHYPHQTITDFLDEVNFYSTLHAQTLRENNIRTNLFQIIFYPIGKFFQNYFWRLGFLDGVQGLIVALMMSLHSFLARAKLYRRNARTRDAKTRQKFTS